MTDKTSFATVHDLYFPLAPITKGDVGVEIEVEFPTNFNREFSRKLTDNWIVKEDGSLRNIGREFITPGAVTLGQLPGSLLHIANEVDPYAIKKSPRTSVHVHVNVQTMPLPSLVTTLASLILWDNILTAYCGDDRVGNNFCLRIKDAEKWVSILTNSYNTLRPFNFGRDREYRYSSINCMSVTRFGTIEFRTMEGTTDVNRINDWSNLVYGLVHTAAVNFKTPEDVLDTYMRSHEEFITKCLPLKHVELLRKSVKDFDGLMKENVMILMDYVESINWKMVLESAKPKPKKNRNDPTLPVGAEQRLLDIANTSEALRAGRTVTVTVAGNNAGRPMYAPIELDE